MLLGTHRNLDELLRRWLNVCDCTISEELFMGRCDAMGEGKSQFVVTFRRKGRMQIHSVTPNASA